MMSPCSLLVIVVWNVLQIIIDCYGGVTCSNYGQIIANGACCLKTVSHQLNQINSNSLELLFNCSWIFAIGSTRCYCETMKLLASPRLATPLIIVSRIQPKVLFILFVENLNLMLRGNTIATKAIESYMKLVGNKYLHDTLEDFVRLILDSEDSCEVSIEDGIVSRRSLILQV